MRVMRWMVLGAALALAPLPALAIFRCSDQGRISYSDTPCPPGQEAARLSSATAADPAQAQQERRQLERQQQQLQHLQNARERANAAEQSARARAEAGRQAHQKKCKLLEMKKRWGEEDAASASLKREAHAKRSARRKAEQYTLECGPAAGS